MFCFDIEGVFKASVERVERGCVPDEADRGCLRSADRERGEAVGGTAVRGFLVGGENSIGLGWAAESFLFSGGGETGLLTVAGWD